MKYKVWIEVEAVPEDGDLAADADLAEYDLDLDWNATAEFDTAARAVTFAEMLHKVGSKVTNGYATADEAAAYAARLVADLITEVTS